MSEYLQHMDAPSRNVQDIELIAALGHELKSLVLLSIPPDETIQVSDLVDTVNEAQDITNESEDPSQVKGLPDNPDQWRLSNNLAVYYLKRFEDRGLVQRYPSGKKYDSGDVRLTQKGISEGQPLAGHLLDLSVHAEISLLNIFPNQNPKSAGRRIDLLAALYENGNSRGYRMRDLAPIVGVRSGVVSEIVKSMAVNQLVDVVFVGNTKPSAVFSLGTSINALATNHPKAGEIYRQVLEEMRQLWSDQPGVQVTNDYFVTKLMALYPDISRSEMASKVWEITGRLSRRGILDRTYLLGDDDPRALVTLNSGQAHVAEHLLDIIHGLEDRDQDFFDHGLELADEILERPELIEFLVGKAMDSSLGIKSKSNGNGDQVADILRSSQEPMSITEIRYALARNGMPLTSDAIRRRITLLGDQDGFAVKEIREKSEQKFVVV